MQLANREIQLSSKVKVIEPPSILSRVCVFLDRDSPSDLHLVLWHMFVVIVFLKPEIADDFALADMSFNLARFGLSVLFILRLLVDTRRRQDAVSISMLLIGVLALVSTLVQHEAIKVALSQLVPIAGFFAWLSLNRNHLLTILFNGFMACSIISLLNFGSQIIAPHGLLTRNDGYIPVWVLGQKQEFLSAYLFLLFSGSVVCVARPSMRKLFLCLLVTVIVSAAIARSAGLLLVCCLIAAQYVVRSRTISRLLTGHLGACCILVACLSLFAGIVQDFLIELLPLLEGIPTSGLSKSRTVGIRLEMWEFGASNFLANPLIGVGKLSEASWYVLSGLDYYHTIYHNFYLDLAASGGVFCLGIFVYLVVKISGAIRINRDEPVAKLCALFVGAVLLLMIMESPYSPLVLGIFACGYYCDAISQQISCLRDRNDVSSWAP